MTRTRPRSRSFGRRDSAMLLAAAAVLIALAVWAPLAGAGEVHFDPDSPAAKEYALPLDQARDEAAGVGKSDGPAGRKAPLFGEGVSSGGSGPSAGGGGTGGGGGGSGSDRAPAGGGSEAGGQGSRGEAASAAVAASISNSDGDYALSSAILWVAAIVALGAIAGLALRAAQRPRSA